jgi:nicotinamidase-related amidase
MAHSDNVIKLPAGGSASRVPLLILVDLQLEYATAGRLHHIKELGTAIENCRRLLVTARRSKWPVAKVRWLQRGNHFSKANKFSDWIEEFRPGVSDMIFEKSGVSCYSSPEFSKMMDECAGEPAILAGLTSAQACLATLVDAATRDHRIIFAVDASATTATDEFDELAAHRSAAFIATQHASVLTTDDILGMFESKIERWCRGSS